ncbi:dihydroorotase [Flaviaesturariibacter flavus]|uniref:Dihydroorotase n=1 Tax=Flaviaesturariibacter flavus TaxID=2502780 RepID=A0A4R1BKN4_9BACT|nr:dihydroorotase [Flaviaesturariibacter flavus]TCJ17847.1 dihydroorotase [Flaviaesturariibacter flavus]
MQQKYYLIRDIQVVNEGRIDTCDVLIGDGRIERIGGRIDMGNTAVTEIDGSGKYLLPGAIDDQVHFREPGLTHKATIYTEAKAAVAGGVTSFMEMPNTQPPVFTQELLEDKYAIAARSALANYSFFMGTSNDNLEEVLRTNEKKDAVCGVKIFMGASTGNLLVDNYLTIGNIFAGSELLIATHCEEESIIRANYARLKAEKGTLTPADHPLVRDEAACFESSLKAVQLAMKHDARLHILHITTERELQLFTNMVPLRDKRITAEVCVHHLHFTSDDYAKHGYDIKCNPAIKAPHNREALWQALLDDRLDVIATDHAPHLRAEKAGDYEHAHAGLPLVQHPLLLMLHYYREGRISLEKIAQKMSHAVADCFGIRGRGYIREGYWADLVIVDLNESTTVSKENILYKCGWSPLEGFTFPARITHTFVNGHPVYANGVWDESHWGQRLRFDR